MKLLIPLFEALTDQEHLISIKELDKEYYLSTFISSVAHNLLNYKKFSSVESSQISDSIMAAIIKLICFYIEKEDNPKISELFKFIFDTSIP